MVGSPTLKEVLIVYFVFFKKVFMVLKNISKKKIDFNFLVGLFEKRFR